MYANKDVDEFFSSSEQIWINLALHHLLMDHLQWMGASNIHNIAEAMV